MPTSSQNPNTRDELIEIVARDPISAGGDEVWATDLVDALEAEVERRVRWQIAADFETFGKRQESLSWGEAHLIAREGLCACRGGNKPCTPEGGAR